MSNNIKPEVTITWGTEKEITKTYIFEAVSYTHLTLPTTPYV